MPTNPAHFVNIYDNPLAATGTQGTRFERRLQAYNYTHSISAFGGFDTMTCTFAVDIETAEAILINNLGSRVACYVDDNRPIWEGFINRITYRPGGMEFTRSFDEMANRVRVLYYRTSTGATEGNSTVVNNTSSQALYGIKDATYDADINYGANVTQKAAVRTIKLAQNAFPLVSSRFSSGGALITIECQGFYWLWDWSIYQNTSVTLRTASIFVIRLANNTTASVPDNMLRIYQTGVGSGSPAAARIVVNSSFNISDENTSGQTYLQVLQGVTESGNGSIPWVLGITPPDPLASGALSRLVYYQPANLNVIYTTKALSEPGVIRDSFGRKIDPWRVQADGVIRVTDVLAGYNLAGSDPRQTYIQQVNYNAETQTVTYQGIDDITNSGAFGLRQRYKKHGRRLKDAPLRVII